MKKNKFLPILLSYCLLMFHFPTFAQTSETDVENAANQAVAQAAADQALAQAEAEREAQEEEAKKAAEAAVVEAKAQKANCQGNLRYNEHADACVNAADDRMIDNKQLQCSWVEEADTKAECMAEIATFGTDKTADIGEGHNEKESGLKGAKTTAGVAGFAVSTFGSAAAQKGVETVFKMFCPTAQATTEASGTCFSKYAGWIAIIMSLINEASLNKDSKDQMSDAKDELHKLVAEQKKSKGRSYEMQVKLMQAYKNTLDVAAQISGQRLDGYKQEMTAQLLVVVVALVDITIAVSSCPLACDFARMTCAFINIATAAVAMGFLTKLISKAEDSKKGYEDKSAKVAKIIKKYQDFFLKQVLDSKTLANNRNAVKINNNGVVNSNQGANVDNDGAEQVDTISEFKAELCAEDPSNECCAEAGDTCQAFSIHGAPSLLLSDLGVDGLEEVLISSNDIINGSNLTLTGDNSFAIDNNMKRMKEIQKKLLNKVLQNKKLTQEQRDKMDPAKIFKAYLKKHFGDENHNFSSSKEVKPIEEVKDAVEEKVSEKVSSKDAEAPAAVPFNLKRFNMNMDDLDDKILDSSASSAVNAAMNGADTEYLYKDEDIVKKPEVSIFNIITNRYNVMRLKKGFGKKKTAK